MYAFDYHRPSSLNEATSALAAHPGAKLLAGGHTLIPALKLRLAEPGHLVDLARVDGLQELAVDGGVLRIGAMVTHATVAGSDVVKKAIPGLAALASGIGDPHVRPRGTIGGSVANNDPAADYPAAVLALGATVHTTKRKLAAEDFFQGLFTTALDEDEILTRIDIPVPKSFTYAKFANPASRYALVGVAVANTSAGPRVAVTGAGESGVFRLKAAEAALTSDFSAKAVEKLTVPAAGLMSDIHAEADYRAHLIGVMLRRALGG
jgi:carbon-monoxide dehydrogenase medium subunit